jgi:hypothetical protein
MIFQYYVAFAGFFFSCNHALSSDLLSTFGLNFSFVSIMRIIFPALFFFLFGNTYSQIISGKVLQEKPLSQESYSTAGPLSTGYSHLPIIMIDTGWKEILNEPKITAHIKVIDNGPGKTNSVYDPGNHYDGPVGIEIRGQSSQMFPKKSFGFETRTADGDEYKVSLLGMPAHDDWVLYAPYSDKTMMRNDLSYYLGRRMGRWQPDAKYAEVYLNGQYIGVYQLIERIKRGKGRVDIAKLESGDISGDAVTGGYIFKADKIHDLGPMEYFYSYPSNRYRNARYYAFTYYYPQFDDIVQAQKNYLRDFLYNFENNLNATWFTNTNSGYSKYIDVASFVDFQIMNELANNVDGYRYSTFFYKQRDSEGGKMLAGPIWDFDLGYGNLNYSQRHMSVNQWAYTNYGPSEGNCLHWWARLMEDPFYAGMLKERYSRLRRTILHADSVMAYLDSRVTLLGDAVGRNFNRWPILGIYVWPNNYIGSTHQAEVIYLKEWIRGRLGWLDSQWLVPVSSVNDHLMSEIRIFPNPARDRIQIQHPEISGGLIEVNLFDSQGRSIYLKTVNGHDNYILEADIGDLSPGVYIIRIADKNQIIYSGKLLKL